jgi:adenylate cyclase
VAAGVAQEIERKFLVKNDSWRSATLHSSEYRQAYLANNERCSVRVRIEGDQAKLNIKTATLGVTRGEYEYSLPLHEAKEMLDRICGPALEKTRHLIEYGGHRWEIDEFHGSNEGLIVAEIELQSEHEPFERPSWLGVEVSDDPRYYNVCLAERPFCDW